MPVWLTPILGVVALVMIVGATRKWYKKWKKQKEQGTDGNSNKKV